MAAPPVTGLVALIIQALGIDHDPAAVYRILTTTATDAPCPDPALLDYTDEGRPPDCPLLCLFYISAIALLAMRSERWRRVFSPLAIVGRMPLTNYLMQSLIFTTLLYSWGADCTAGSARRRASG